MKIDEINPWWKTGNIEKEFEILEKRELFDELVNYINDKQIITISGLRRTGKTVLMHQLIQHLLSKNKKENIFYYSFDLFDDKIENIIENYREITGLDIKKEKIFIFIDEIQKHNNWENELKVLYDNFSNMKFFISGSSSLFIEKKTKESLAGRSFTFISKPLRFAEYLKLKNRKNILNNLLLYREELEKEFEHYIKTGGFPELINETDNTKISRYIKELVLDKIIYIDIPKSFKIEEPELLTRIFEIISANPGMILDYETLAVDLKRNRKTISNYTAYLEKAFLIKKLYNYSKNLLTSEKKLKKFYSSSTAFACLFNADTGKIIENSVMMNYDFKFFSRNGEKEVDFITIKKNNIIPVEIKYSNLIKEKEIKGLLYFMEKHKLKKGFVITKHHEEENNIDGAKIKMIPLFKWFLINEKELI